MSDPATPETDKARPANGAPVVPPVGAPVGAKAPEAVKPEAAKPEVAKPDMAKAGPARPGAAGVKPPLPNMTPAVPVAEPVPPAVSRSTVAVLTAVGFVVLLAGLVVLWSQFQDLSGRVASAEDVAALREQVRTLQQRIGALEARPAAAPAAAPVDLKPLEGRVAALEQRPVAAPAPVPVVDPALAGRVARLARLQRAASALEAGVPLGEIPGAVPALAKFATVAPPTEAQLRLDFPAIAQRARAASRAPEDGMASRVSNLFQRLVTVREGERVVVGTPAAVLLGDAATRLNAGDLGGAVKLLGGLDPGAAQAMAPWRERAEALLAARGALAAMPVD